MRVYIVLLISILFISSCDHVLTSSRPSSYSNVPVSGVALNNASITIPLAGTVQLVANIEPLDSSNKSHTWSTSNGSIATVSETGLVTGNAIGTAEITVTTSDGDHTANCTVEVYSARVPVSGVGLTRHNTTIMNGLVEQLVADVYPNQASNQTLTWSSDNPSVASVSEIGLITTRSIGTAVITVSTVDGGFHDECTVEVVSWPGSEPLPRMYNSAIFLPTSYPADSQYFGYSLAAGLNGSRIAVGMPWVNLTYELEGAVIVYNWDGSDWVHETINMPSSFYTYQPQFGGSLAMSHDGSVLVAGLRFAVNDPFWVFRRVDDTWVPTEMPDMSGEALDISADGSVIAAGHCYTKTTALYGDGIGMVHIYRHDGSDWQHEVDLYSDFEYEWGSESNHFGYGLDLSADGNMLVASTHLYYEEEVIHLFEYNGTDWVQQHLLGSGQTNDYCGVSLAISPNKNYILAGAPFYDITYSSEGLCLLYTRQPDNTWSVSEITPPEPHDQYDPYNFGWKVYFINDTRFIVGCKTYVPSGQNPIDNTTATAVFYAYIYTLVDGEWQYEKIITQDGYYGDYFGNSFALLNDSIILIGAPKSYQASIDYDPAGAVYLYSY